MRSLPPDSRQCLKKCLQCDERVCRTVSSSFIELPIRHQHLPYTYLQMRLLAMNSLSRSSRNIIYRINSRAHLIEYRRKYRFVTNPLTIYLYKYKIPTNRIFNYVKEDITQFIIAKI